MVYNVIMANGKSPKYYVDKYCDQLEKEIEERERREREERAKAQKGSDVRNDSQSVVQVIDSNDYLIVKNIKCVDAEDNVFEHYDRLLVAKDVERYDKSIMFFTAYGAARYLERHRSFSPSFALGCNIVATLFMNGVEINKDGSYETLDEEAKKVLDQYRDIGIHLHNTIINFANGRIIHYPDVFDYYSGYAVNISRKRKEFGFKKSVLETENLESALQNYDKLRFVKQLTGLIDPYILVEIGRYFGKPAKLSFPWNGNEGVDFKSKQATLFGCDSNNFNFYFKNSMENVNPNAIRRVSDDSCFLDLYVKDIEVES